MLVLGVDPGSITTGYGIVRKNNNLFTCITSGAIESSGDVPFYDRIFKIFEKMVELMELYKPDEMAIEDVFFAKNVKSSLKLGHARGAALIAAVKCNVKIYEYTPLEIKQSVVGYGRATKEQVSSMVRMILNLPSIKRADTTDALAAAICHLNWTRYEKKI
ncbi:MAG: crossover junction endodeoxyribonuclease RuvC [Desulfatiglans sp.]|jgi:crossover junction endodeoxyribonuclease RuvC|nr:crossover junction endodeoxyribonuclease RuvC [Desulfatiglans sp.]